MTPTENELRAFLRDGEGDVPDAVSVMSHAMRERDTRRKRFTAIATSAAVAVVVAGGSVLLVNLGHGNEQGGSGGGDTAAGSAFTQMHSRHATSAKPSAAAGGTNSRNKGANETTTGGGLPNTFRNGPAALRGLPMCALKPNQLAMPGGGGLNAFGANGKVWQHQPTALRLCVYSNGKPVSRIEYDPKQIRLITDSIESAPIKGKASSSCTAPDAKSSTINIYALDKHHHALKPVVLTVPWCGAAEATNGTAVRHPISLPGLLHTLVHRASVGH